MNSSGANLIAVERIVALFGLDCQLELVDHPPATPSAPVLGGVEP